ncbi:MAG: DNA-binding response regulator [Acidobacteria bacterium]|nr:MAG: DNA-binding response regulator [Acidobacteriota bacterium]
MISVLIALEHAIFRRGVKNILAETLEGATFAEARTAQEALDFARKHGWELILLDINMPGGSGLDPVSELKRLCPQAAILVLGTHPEEQFARRSLKSGAAGFLTKESVPEELTKAARRVLAGGLYLSAALAEALAGDLSSGTERPPHEILSDREFQVMRMLASGKTLTEIAKDLSLSVKTVSTYRSRLLSKTGLKNNSELIRYAFQHQLVK